MPLLRRRMPLLAAVISSLVACLLQPAGACMDTAWSKGHLGNTSIDAFTLASPGGTSSCACCAFCHKNTECASFGFNANTNACVLYGTVADYTTIVVDSSWMYFVMPGRSQHNQFCREDSDCRTEGDSCRGRVCTTEAAITCRVVYETLGAGDRLGHYVRLYGWLNNQSLALQCRMRVDWPGFTRLFRNQHGTALNRTNFRSYNPDLTRDTRVHSILDLAEDIRELRDSATYELRTVAKCSDNDAYDVWHLTESAIVNRTQPVLVEIPVNDTSLEGSVPFLSLPYLLPSGEDILNVKVNIELEGGSLEQIALPLARTDGWIWLFQSVSLYIRE